jgi:hypothetical protein
MVSRIRHTIQFTAHLQDVETSAIGHLLKTHVRPGSFSFAGGFPDGAMFDVDGLREVSGRALADEPSSNQCESSKLPKLGMLSVMPNSRRQNQIIAVLLVTTGFPSNSSRCPAVSEDFTVVQLIK